MAHCAKRVRHKQLVSKCAAAEPQPEDKTRRSESLPCLASFASLAMLRDGLTDYLPGLAGLPGLPGVRGGVALALGGVKALGRSAIVGNIRAHAATGALSL